MQTERFMDNASAAVSNDGLQVRLRVLNNFIVRRNAAFERLENAEGLRDRARAIKEKVLADLDAYLLQLEERVTELGGKVHWARDGAEACQIVLGLARANQVKRLVKSKSMVTEEIGLNEALEHAGIEAVETDLGEYIVQVAGERPSHILAPAIHKSRADISQLFADRLGFPNLEEPEEITAATRRKLRAKFCTAEMGITGVNFAIAETGTIVLVENEGNIRFCTSLPRIHVALMGIEKVIPSLQDLSVFLKLLAPSAGGQKMSSYVSFITGPKGRGETDGANEFHLVILDNGRTRILRDPARRESLYCLRCGACLNICPVYQKIGGHAYGSVYSGPIGSAITPPLVGIEKSKDLPYASTLCGACKDICPVKINIPHLLLNLRKEWVEETKDRSKGPAPIERIAMRLWAFAMRHPHLYAAVFRLAGLLQRSILSRGKFDRLPLWGAWGKSRDFPQVARKPFRSLWREIERD